jgi:ribosome-binding protein aMBF1 (putative translation factor)
MKTHRTFTDTEVADRWGVPVSEVRVLSDRGQLPAYSAGRQNTYVEPTIEGYELAREFGQRVRHLRAESGESLATVATRAAISPAHLRNVEQVTCVPTLAIARRVASALGADLRDLLPETERTETR